MTLGTVFVSFMLTGVLGVEWKACFEKGGLTNTAHSNAERLCIMSVKGTAFLLDHCEARTLRLASPNVLTLVDGKCFWLKKRDNICPNNTCPALCVDHNDRIANRSIWCKDCGEDHVPICRGQTGSSCTSTSNSAQMSFDGPQLGCPIIETRHGDKTFLISPIRRTLANSNVWCKSQNGSTLTKQDDLHVLENMILPDPNAFWIADNNCTVATFLNGTVSFQNVSCLDSYFVVCTRPVTPSSTVQGLHNSLRPVTKTTTNTTPVPGYANTKQTATPGPQHANTKQTATPGPQPGYANTKQTSTPGPQPGYAKTKQTATPGPQHANTIQTATPGPQPGYANTKQTSTPGPQPGYANTKQTATPGPQHANTKQTATPGPQPGYANTKQTATPGPQHANTKQTATPGPQPGYANTKQTSTPGPQPGYANTKQTSTPGPQPGYANTKQTATPGPQHANTKQTATPGPQPGYANTKQTATPRPQPGYANTKQTSTPGPQPGYANTKQTATPRPQPGYANTKQTATPRPQPGYANTKQTSTPGPQPGYANTKQTATPGPQPGYANTTQTATPGPQHANTKQTATPGPQPGYANTKQTATPGPQPGDANTKHTAGATLTDANNGRWLTTTRNNTSIHVVLELLTQVNAATGCRRWFLGSLLNLATPTDLFTELRHLQLNGFYWIEDAKEPNDTDDDCLVFVRLNGTSSLQAVPCDQKHNSICQSVSNEGLLLNTVFFENILSEIVVNRNDTGKEFRSKNTVWDSRTTAHIMGGSGIIFMIIFTVIVGLCDLPYLKYCIGCVSDRLVTVSND